MNEGSTTFQYREARSHQQSRYAGELERGTRMVDALITNVTERNKTGQR